MEAGDAPEGEVPEEVEGGNRGLLSLLNPFLPWRILKSAYSGAVNMLLRPPRSRYRIRTLGPKRFRLLGQWFVRRDFTVMNARGLKLECSHWEVEDDRVSERPCVVCLHGNGSSRAASMAQLETVLGMGATMVGFDFAGSGRSEGTYVTLGWHEKDDVAAVMEHLRAERKVGAIGLWGSSMGAATALLHAPRDPSVAALVLDSPFADLRQLVNELILDFARQAGAPPPAWGVALVLTCVQATVMQASGLDIMALRPLEHAPRSYVPAFFIAGRKDDFVRPHHATALLHAYAGEKEIVYVPQGHGDLRPPEVFAQAGAFLRRSLHISPDLEPPEAAALAISPPFRCLRRAFESAPAEDGAAASPFDEDDEMVQRAIQMSRGDIAATEEEEDEMVRRAIEASMADN